MSNKKTSNVCICHGDKPFEECCDRFLNQGQIAKTPMQLMRSRYSAFALGGYGEYLLATWSPGMSSDLNAASLSMNSTDWQSLEIVGNSQKADQGFVEFKAFYKDADGKRCVHHEKSVFERVDGRWLYVSGEVS